MRYFVTNMILVKTNLATRRAPKMLGSMTVAAKAYPDTKISKNLLYLCVILECMSESM